MLAARTTLSLLLLVGLVAAAGCDGCAEDPTGTDDDGRTTLPPNGTPGDDDDDDDDDDNEVPEARDLAFSGESPVEVFYGQQVQLPFTLTTRSGVKVTGEDVRFEVTGTDALGGQTDWTPSDPFIVNAAPNMPGSLTPSGSIVTSYPTLSASCSDPTDDASLLSVTFEVRPGEVPVFWACGVTPQAAIMSSAPPFAIGHAPGMMAITDARDSGLVIP